MAEHFSFDRIQMRRMVKQLIREELEPREDLAHRPLPHYHAIDHLAGTAYSTITAMSGAVPGTGQVQAKKFTTGEAADYADAPGNVVDVLNFGPAIATGTYVACDRHRETGKWIARLLEERSVRYLVGSGTLAAGASALMSITGTVAAATGNIYTIDTGEAVIAPIGRYLAGFLVGFANSGSRTEDVPLQVDLQQYVSGLMSWATVDTARGYYLGLTMGSDKPITLSSSVVFETTEANQHIRVYATNLGGTDTVAPQNYSHLWIKALDA